MAGTREGGLKAAKANRERHGQDFYKRLGRRGGAAGHTGGFAGNSELARELGHKGGLARAEKYKKLKEMKNETTQ